MMDNRTIRCFMMIALCWAVARGGVWAMDGRVIPIGVSEFPPFEFTRNQKVVGIDTEIVEQVLERAGYTPEFKMMPWKRAQLLAQKGILAGIYSLTKTPERERHYYFSNPLNTVRDVFFKQKGKDITWTTMADLKDYRVGASSGYGYPRVFLEAVKNRTFKQVDMLNGESMELRHLQKLSFDRVDLVICEISVCQYLIRLHAPDFDGIDFIDRTIGEERGYYIGFSKKWQNADRIVQAFNNELGKFIAQGRRKTIFETYGITSSLD